MKDSHFPNIKDKEIEDSRRLKLVEQINKSKALSYQVYLIFLEDFRRKLRIK